LHSAFAVDGWRFDFEEFCAFFFVKAVRFRIGSVGFIIIIIISISRRDGTGLARCLCGLGMGSGRFFAA